MLSESTSSLSVGPSEESILKRGVADVRGIPDIFSTPSAVNRTLLKTVRRHEQYSFRVETKDLICRICHGGNSSGDLLTPCKCKGSIALAHLHCLELWLNESNKNECELCQYHFKVIREPTYGVLWSILVFLRHPGHHLNELLVDLVTLVVYTPSTITSTYMLLLLCESISNSQLKYRRTVLSHVMAFAAVFGIAAINFTYTSWLVLTLDKYIDYWQEWYRKTCTLKVVLSASKLSFLSELHPNPAP